MSKIKLAVTLIAVAIIASGATAYARTVYLPWTVNIMSISDVEDSSNGYRKPTVSTFEHNGNRCYVVNSDANNTTAQDNIITISCVREKNS